METKEIIRKLQSNNIIGIKVNGIFYIVNYVDTDYFEENTCTDYDGIVISAYQLDENNCYLEYEFTMDDLVKARELKLYTILEV